MAQTAVWAHGSSLPTSAVALSPAKRLCQQIIDKKLDIKWTCEMRFEKHLSRELLHRCGMPGA